MVCCRHRRCRQHTRLAYYCNHGWKLHLFRHHHIHCRWSCWCRCRYLRPQSDRRPNRSARQDELVDKMKENLYDSFRVPMSTISVTMVVCYDVVVAVEVVVDVVDDCMYLVGDKCKLVYRSDEDVLSLWECLDNSWANVLCHLEYVGIRG